MRRRIPASPVSSFEFRHSSFRPRIARGGFTLIELLVVIGIILVLIAIVVVGLRHVNNTAARHETVAEMKVCTDILKQYQSINGLKNVEGDLSAGSITGPDLPPPFMTAPGYQTPKLPIFVDPPAQGSEITGQQPQSTLRTQDLIVGGGPGGIGDMGDKGGIANPRWASKSVQWTQAVMFILLKDPKNRALISQLPPKRILETPPPLNPGGNPNPPYTVDAAVALDGWGNPIIYVPRGGLHVWLNPTNSSSGPTEYVIRSSGMFPVTGGTIPPVGPNDRPFFASAGQDGYFTDPSNGADYAVDNLYSFQDQ